MDSSYYKIKPFYLSMCVEHFILCKLYGTISLISKGK